MDSFVPIHDSFYLTLESGSSLKLHPENTNTCFYNQLPMQIDLRHGDWQVGLADLNMPSKWDNVTDSFDTFLVKMPDLDYKYEMSQGSLNVKTVIRKDDNTKSLYHKVIDHMFTSITNEKVKDTFEFHIVNVEDEERFVVKFKEANSETFLKFPKVYCELLGLYSGFCDKWITGDTIEGLKPLDQTLRRLDTCKFPPFYIRHVVVRDTPLKLIGNECIENLLYQSNTYQLQHGTYESLETLLKGMRGCLTPSMRKYFDFQQNNNGTITLLCGPWIKDEAKSQYPLTDSEKDLLESFSITFPKSNPGLGFMLGFDVKQIDKGLPHNTQSLHIADINRGIQNLFVNSSLIKKQIIGDRTEDLLRKINRPDNNMTNIPYDLTFNPIYYHPLETNLFDIIDISITSDDGKDIAFKRGKTFATLHFKRCIDIEKDKLKNLDVAVNSKNI